MSKPNPVCQLLMQVLSWYKCLKMRENDKNLRESVQQRFVRIPNIVSTNNARVDIRQRKFFNYYNCNLPNPRTTVTFAININTKTVRKPQNTPDNVPIHNFI